MQALLRGAPCSLEGEVMRVFCSNVKVRMEQVQTEHPCWCSVFKKNPCSLKEVFQRTAKIL